MVTQLIRGRQETPDYGILLGVPGVGKSSFIGGWTDMTTGTIHNGAPNPVIIGPERNPELNCVKFPRVEDYETLLLQINELLSGKHDGEGFQTVGVDSIDMIQKLINQMICQRCRVQNIDAINYGGGRKQAFAELIGLEKLLNQLHEKKGFNVWIVAHTTVRPVNDPLIGLNYDCHEMALWKSATGKMDSSQIFTEKVSTILFANQKVVASEQGQAISTGQRALYTEYRPGHLAKNRYGLPYELPLFYDQYAYGKNLFFNGGVSPEQLQNSVNAEIEQVKLEISKLVSGNKNISPQVFQTINQSVNMAQNNLDELKRILTKIRAMIQ